jgi:hypothetical protein
MAKIEMIDMVMNPIKRDNNHSIQNTADEKEKIKEMYFWVESIELALSRNGYSGLLKNPCES